MMVSRPAAREGVREGSVSVFSRKMKEESSAATSAGEYGDRTFSRMSSVRTSSSAPWI